MKLFSILLVGGGAVVLSKLLALKNAGDELAVSVGDIGISKIQNGALNLWAELWYDNFTDTTLHIQQPTAKIFLNDTTTEIGHAIPSVIITDIPPNGRNTTAATIPLSIPLSNIAFAIPALLAGEKANRKILIQIKCQVNGFKYETEKTYTI